MSGSATHVRSIGAELGEGPIWVEREQALWFVDIVGCRLHRYRPADDAHQSWPAPEKISFVVPVRGGGFLVGLKSGLFRFDMSSGSFAHEAAIESHPSGNRLNDGCVGPDGALWFGSMHDAETDASGSLYRFDKTGRVVRLDGGYTVANGPAFSPSGEIFYHTDSASRVVYAFDRAPTGELSGKREFVRIEEDAGHPDGTTVDSEGCLWIALWKGWAVRRYSPTGELLHAVKFPCANVTKIGFAGADLRTAYATTARAGLTAGELAAQPLAGDLFSFRAPAAGIPSVSLDLGAEL